MSSLYDQYFETTMKKKINFINVAVILQFFDSFPQLLEKQLSNSKNDRFYAPTKQRWESEAWTATVDWITISRKKRVDIRKK